MKFKEFLTDLLKDVAGKGECFGSDIVKQILDCMNKDPVNVKVLLSFITKVEFIIVTQELSDVGKKLCKISLYPENYGCEDREEWYVKVAQIIKCTVEEVRKGFVNYNLYFGMYWLLGDLRIAYWRYVGSIIRPNPNDRTSIYAHNIARHTRARTRHENEWDFYAECDAADKEYCEVLKNEYKGEFPHLF